MVMASRRKQPSIECNKELVNMLLEIGDYEKNVSRSVVKYNAYRKAANAIGKLKEPVRSGKDACKLPGIGKKIAEKIDQFLRTGTMEKITKIRGDTRTQAIEQLTRVSGIGPAHAAKLHEQGIDSIEKLRKHPEHLTHHQKIGLKYLEDFEQRVPREEIAKFETILKAAARAVDPALTATVCGSYRRGAASSGDVDALVTHKDLLSTDKAYKRKAGALLAKLVAELTKMRLVTDTISQGDTKFMGVAVLPKGRARSQQPSTTENETSEQPSTTDTTDGSKAPPAKRKRRSSKSDTTTTEADATETKSASSVTSSTEGRPVHRRLDLKMSPSDQYPFGTLHFTGSDEFNRQMRARALDAGFTLNEYCVRPVGATGQPGEPVPVGCERDIFDVIRMEYVPPEKRTW